MEPESGSASPLAAPRVRWITSINPADCGPNYLLAACSSIHEVDRFINEEAYSGTVGEAIIENGYKKVCKRLKWGVIDFLAGARDDGDSVSCSVWVAPLKGLAWGHDGLQYLLEKHLTTARRICPSLVHKHVTPHVLRHSLAMDLL